VFGLAGAVTLSKRAHQRLSWGMALPDEAASMSVMYKEDGAMARILLVDDEPNIRLFYSAALADEGHEVIEASSWAEALRFLEAEPLDLVVLDIRLGSQSGLELLQRIASHPARVPVIILTAYASFQDDYTTWLAESYILKSSDPTEFLTEVHRVLDRRSGRSVNIPFQPGSTLSDASLL